uniref:Putative lipid transfer-like protein VAS n=1 Tax=Davidia involucrata TaxID=16924 RepID=A0A5B7BIU8_DAVIN
MGNSKMFALMTVVVVVLMVATRVAEGQSTPSCAQKLVPCANFINATTPPASCCDPLREAVTQERDCLCNLYNTPGLLASFGINVTQAVLLAGHCNIPGDLSACKNASAPLPPPSVPGGNDSDSGVGRIAWTGMSSLVLFWASMMLY